MREDRTNAAMFIEGLGVHGERMRFEIFRSSCSEDKQNPLSTAPHKHLYTYTTKICRSKNSVQRGPRRWQNWQKMLTVHLINALQSSIQNRTEHIAPLCFPDLPALNSERRYETRLLFF